MNARLASSLPSGLAFTTLHHPELIDVNVLTNPDWDPKSGTAEFKAAAVRVERVAPALDSEAGGNGDRAHRVDTNRRRLPWLTCTSAPISPPMRSGPLLTSLSPRLRRPP